MRYKDHVSAAMGHSYDHSILDEDPQTIAMIILVNRRRVRQDLNVDGGVCTQSLLSHLDGNTCQLRP